MYRISLPDATQLEVPLCLKGALQITSPISVNAANLAHKQTHVYSMYTATSSIHQHDARMFYKDKLYTEHIHIHTGKHSVLKGERDERGIFVWVSQLHTHTVIPLTLKI